MRDTSGYFGPDSVTWRVLSDPSAMLGGGRALLVQALHPGAMAIFAQNSYMHDDPWKRIVRTARYLEVTVFGSMEQADRASSAIRKMHGRIQGTDPRTGRTLCASDPELLLWVHATTVHSFLAAYRRFAYRLSDEDQDRYVRESVVSAEMVGLDPTAVPATAGELSDYLRGITILEATPEAREGMRKILFAPPMPIALRPLWGGISAGLVSLLPKRARELYGLKWSPALNVPIRGTGFLVSRVYNVMAAQRVRNHFSCLRQTETSGRKSTSIEAA